MEDGILIQVALLIIVFVTVWFLLPFGLRKVSENRLARLCRERRAIVLSYDDGPSRILTPRLLDFLAERGVSATFFVLGNSALDNPGVVKRALEDGHEVGSHSFEHFNAWKVGPGRSARDISSGISAVRSLGGDGQLFRPPYGKQTLAGFLDAVFKRLRIAWWTVDTKDTRTDGTRRSFEAVVKQIDAAGGGVVLAHDFDKSTLAPDGMSHGDYVMALTERIIEYAEANGYTLMRLGDVLREETYG